MLSIYLSVYLLVAWFLPNAVWGSVSGASCNVSDSVQSRYAVLLTSTVCSNFNLHLAQSDVNRLWYVSEKLQEAPLTDPQSLFTSDWAKWRLKFEKTVLVSNTASIPALYTKVNNFWCFPDFHSTQDGCYTVCCYTVYLNRELDFIPLSCCEMTDLKHEMWQKQIINHTHATHKQSCTVVYKKME